MRIRSRQGAAWLVVVAGMSMGCGAQPPAVGPSAPKAPPLDWRTLEAGVLSDHVQLTRRDQFTKAGEAYFSPDGSWIVFQAVPVPKAGSDPEPFYSMYVAKLTRDAAGRINGTETPILISPPGSANTCGWFHPTRAGVVLFGSTIEAPKTDQKGGFQVGQRKYVWLFPEETEVCERFVPEIGGATAAGLWADDRRVSMVMPLFSRPEYDAECSYSADGRFVLYAHVRPKKTAERADADIWVYDTRTGRHHAIVVADGYDGGPFFSPDGKRICYRSDRKLNDQLQLFVADLKFDGEGVPVGIEREYQITDNTAVNWAPFFHPSGKFLVYGTSQVSHQNYEVFAIELDEAKLAADGPVRKVSAALNGARITSADGADVLPVFDAKGEWMMWTGQRGPIAEGEQRSSSQLWVARFNAAGVAWGK
ncbi:MAG: TolB family protein [Phycisphaerales bacterium]